MTYLRCMTNNDRGCNCYTHTHTHTHWSSHLNQLCGVNDITSSYAANCVHWLQTSLFWSQITRGCWLTTERLSLQPGRLPITTGCGTATSIPPWPPSPLGRVTKEGKTSNLKQKLLMTSSQLWHNVSFQWDGPDVICLRSQKLNRVVAKGPFCDSFKYNI